MRVVKDTATAEGVKKNKVFSVGTYERGVVRSYTDIKDEWYEIKRANARRDKHITFNAVRLIGKLVYELYDDDNRPVYKDNFWFSEITRVGNKQNERIRRQISHIFNFRFYHYTTVKGRSLKNVYEISFAEKARKILNLSTKTGTLAELIKINKKNKGE